MDEWRDLLDDLASDGPAPQPAAASADDLDEWADLREELVPARRVPALDQHAAAVDQIQATQVGAPVFSEDMFGVVDDLRHVGSTLQRGVFAAFCRACTSGRCRGEVFQQNGEVMHQVTMVAQQRSDAVLAERLDKSTTHTTRMIDRIACLLLHGAAWLIAAFLSAWCNLLGQPRQDRFHAVAVLEMFKYDETPLKLQIREFASFAGRAQENIPESVLRHRKSKERETKDTYCHAKIFAVEWKYGCLPGFACLV